MKLANKNTNIKNKKFLNKPLIASVHTIKMNVKLTDTTINAILNINETNSKSDFQGSGFALRAPSLFMIPSVQILAPSDNAQRFL